MLTLIGSPLNSQLSTAWLGSKLGSAWLGTALFGAQLGSVRLYSGLDSGLCSELGLVRLGSVSGLGSGEADKKC